MGRMSENGWNPWWLWEQHRTLHSRGWRPCFQGVLERARRTTAIVWVGGIVRSLTTDRRSYPWSNRGANARRCWWATHHSRARTNLRRRSRASHWGRNGSSDWRASSAGTNSWRSRTSCRDLTWAWRLRGRRRDGCSQSRARKRRASSKGDRRVATVRASEKGRRES